MENRRHQHSPAKRRLIIFYIICLHFLAAVLIFKTDFIPKFKAKFLEAPKHTNPHGEIMILFHQAMDASVPAGASIFLGDSITQGLATAAVAPYSVNYGIGSATTTELLGNIAKYQSLKRASAIFLMIGINDIGHEKTEVLAAKLAAINDVLPNDIPIIWSGIMPAYRKNIDPAKITSANGVIRDLCDARNLCTYVDTHSLFSKGGQDLFRDGLHPNDQGYAVWIDALRKTFQELSGEKSMIRPHMPH